MVTHSEAYIIFYSFIGCIAGIGLFFSRSMDKDVNRYFWAGMSKGGGMIVFTIFLLTLLNALILVLPSLSVQSLSPISIIIVSAAFIIPLLFGKKILSFIENLIESSSRTTTVFLNLLGLIFLCSVQILVLEQVTDYVIVQFFGGTQYSILVVMIVAAGIYTMAGGLNAVLYTNTIAGSLSIISIVFIFLNTFFFNHPLFFTFRTALQSSAEIFRVSGIMEINLAITVVAIILMMFCMIWLEIGEVYRKVSVVTRNIFSRKLFGVGAVVFVMMIGILFFATTTAESIPDAAVSTADPINYFVAVSFLGGLMGIFAMTFQMVGSTVAVRVYPYFKKMVGEEEQILVGRLATVFVVLLSIILISFSKISEYKTFVWYVNFITFFFTPIIAAVFSAFLVRKGAVVGFMFGMFVGEIYALIEFIRQQFEFHSSFLQSASAYAFAVEIAVVTLFVGIVSAVVSEMVVVQKMMSRIKISRLTTL
jgi:SSS family solute:Na+ symporter